MNKSENEFRRMAIRYFFFAAAVHISMCRICRVNRIRFFWCFYARGIPNLDFFNASVDGRNPNLENASVSPAKGPMMSHHLHFKWLIFSEADSSRKKKIFRLIILKYFSAGCVKSDCKCVFIINM